MLYIGEEVGRRGADADAPRSTSPSTRSRARTSSPTARRGAITVLAASEKGGLTHAPDTYLEKLCVGPVAAGKVDIREPPDRELASHRGGARPAGPATSRSSSSTGRATTTLIAEVRDAGARIKLISDGDLSAAISLRRVGHRRPRRHGHRRRAGGRDHRRGAALPRRRDPGPLPLPQRRRAGARRSGWATATRTASTAPRSSPRASNLVFAATGVTDGDLLEGVRFFGGGAGPIRW